MMLTSALTSVLLGTLRKQKEEDAAEDMPSNLADEHIPGWWIAGGTFVCSVALIWIVCRWFGMSWQQAMAAILMQGVLIIAGLRVLAVTGNGPVSLLANATQFFYGFIWRGQIKGNLQAALISAGPESVSETSVPSFWVAQRLGGKFKTLIIAQLIVIPVGAVIVPIMFNVLESTYGIRPQGGPTVGPHRPQDRGSGRRDGEGGLGPATRCAHGFDRRRRDRHPVRDPALPAQAERQPALPVDPNLVGPRVRAHPPSIHVHRHYHRVRVRGRVAEVLSGRRRGLQESQPGARRRADGRRSTRRLDRHAGARRHPEVLLTIALSEGFDGAHTYRPHLFVRAPSLSNAYLSAKR